MSCHSTVEPILQNRARIALKQAEVAVIEARRHVAALETEAREQARLAELASREAQVKLNEVDSVSCKVFGYSYSLAISELTLFKSNNVMFDLAQEEDW